jgi:hypothetical protein
MLEEEVLPSVDIRKWIDPEDDFADQVEADRDSITLGIPDLDSTRGNFTIEVDCDGPLVKRQKV